MCGVIGYAPNTIDEFCELDEVRNAAFAHLLAESRVRGMHAYGVAQPGGRTLSIGPVGQGKVIEKFDPHLPAVAHCRYSTSGDWQEVLNNQPIHVSGMFLAFNGVIHMGTKEEFEKAFDVRCETDNDGEVFLRKLELGVRPADFILNMTGSFAGCWLQGGVLWAGRNARRPLWWVNYAEAKWFASTRDIFRRAGFPEPEEVGIGVELA